jgi:hypothetical protein
VIDEERSMAKASRISPEEAFQKQRAGKALLVCAYDSDEQFRNLQLAGAISLSELRGRLPGLPKDQELVFYCA